MSETGTVPLYVALLLALTAAMMSAPGLRAAMSQAVQQVFVPEAGGDDGWWAARAVPPG